MKKEARNQKYIDFAFQSSKLSFLALNYKQSVNNLTFFNRN
jgi:hypothetical protein